MTTFNTTSIVINERNHNSNNNNSKRSKRRSLVVIKEDIINKPKRKRITPEQFCLLTESFKQTDTPNHELREKLAKSLNMTNREVQVWFQNRRAKINRDRLQQEENIKKIKVNYWSTPSTPLTSIDILLTAAAYIQKWDEDEQKRKQEEVEEKPKKYKSWRPWL
ncbi:homeobox domain-containing protein [Cokeromyces recurvatus]|uniref:homeobox domain-containing protein n=1 Tax=Cokeromyces recurvatus TaxID=90255 RepID=UPI002220B65D|nr:homeobox domain-containing protein [Cokeromyces recurvatus]KAI7901645.1 homeobox domain-containing protein [Cokeromyces recurvatus]